MEKAPQEAAKADLPLVKPTFEGEEGITDAKLQLWLERLHEKTSPIYENLRGYAGWLITNPQYRKELLDLRQQGEELVASAGTFPAIFWLSTPDELRRYRPDLLPPGGSAGPEK